MAIIEELGDSQNQPEWQRSRLDQLEKFREVYGALPGERLPEEELTQRMGSLLERGRRLNEVLRRHHVKLDGIDSEGKYWDTRINMSSEDSMYFERYESWRADIPSFMERMFFMLPGTGPYGGNVKAHAEYILGEIEEYDNERAMRAIEDGIDRLFTPAEVAFGLNTLKE